ncbi:hypothetical protein, partial [Thermus scotoductus]|uniref:hypothetical protein n=1 Tax=Thermus scotoductus TaxID=37636 RepID=UPI001C12AD70
MAEITVHRPTSVMDKPPTLMKYLRVLLDPNPWGVKKEGVPCSKIVSTPFTILTRKPFWWLPTFG